MAPDLSMALCTPKAYPRFCAVVIEDIQASRGGPLNDLPNLSSTRKTAAGATELANSSRHLEAAEKP